MPETRKELEQQYITVQQAARGIAAALGEGSEAFKKSAAEVRVLSERLKDIDKAIGRNTSGGGNYRGVFFSETDLKK